MIVVKLIGGLGNQMFQYAAGRKLSVKYGVDLKLDISGFEVYKLHKYALDGYNIQATIATREEIQSFIKNSDNTFIQEVSPMFDERLLSPGSNVYLSGHWQSEKYFFDIKDIIHKELTVNKDPEGQDAELMKKIREANSVSLHIRRGDFLTNRDHGACDLDYYARAISYISKKVENPTFFVFSDDYLWVKDNLKIDFPTTYVHHNNADKNYEDLRLMSACKHNIIANSTFSWWGAWLNTNPDKIIITPKEWFGLTLQKDSSQTCYLKAQLKSVVYKIIIVYKRWFGVNTYSVKDLIPDSWIKM